MATPRPRVKVPRSAEKGEVIEIKTLISHEMETGLRKDKQGNPIPRNIINKFVCKYNGEVVFSVDLEPAISANPYMQFYVKATESGELEFIWHEDGGAVYSKTASITVS